MLQKHVRDESSDTRKLSCNENLESKLSGTRGEICFFEKNTWTYNFYSTWGPTARALDLSSAFIAMNAHATVSILPYISTAKLFTAWSHARPYIADITRAFFTFELCFRACAFFTSPRAQARIFVSTNSTHRPIHKFVTVIYPYASRLAPPSLTELHAG